MARWTAFAGLTAVLLSLLLGLARLSQSQVTDQSALPAPEGSVEGHADGIDEAETTDEPGGIDDDAGTTSNPGPDGTGPGPEPGRATADPVADPFDPDTTDPPDDPDTTDTPETTEDPERPPATRDDGSPGSARAGPPFDGADAPARPTPRAAGRGPDTRRAEVSPGALAANVALSQGLFGSLLATGAWLFAIPPAALGIAVPSASAVAAGVALGLGLYAANEVGSVAAGRMGVGPDEGLRELLAPDSLRGWVLLLGVVLPVVAGVEELLFRAALVGAVPAGFGVSPWPLAVLSSLAFGLAHGAQGRAGIAVAGALGFVLAAAFVLTESLLVVFLAHYLVNALEFLVHEGLGVDWGR